MQNTLYRKYQQVLNKRKLAVGGDVNPYQVSASLGVEAINALDKGDYNGYQKAGSTIGKSVLTDAATGAAIGSVIPGVGTLVGAGVGAAYGAVSGWISAGSNKAKENNQLSNQSIQQRMQETRYSNAQLGADPTLATGNQNASYFAKGGSMTEELAPYGYMGKGGSIHIKPSHKGLFTKYKERTGKTTEEALHSSDPHVRKMANFAKNASHWHHKGMGGTFEGTVDPNASFIKNDNDETSNPNLKRNFLSELMMKNGSAKMLSSDNTVIKGPSHAEGGVDIPELGTQVEGGETTKGNFVFSKQLGFAQQHLPIARAIGIIQKKPQTKERVNSLQRMMAREDELAQQQESLKKQNGIS